MHIFFFINNDISFFLFIEYGGGAFITNQRAESQVEPRYYFIEQLFV
jgi:hypothetical protein